MQPFDHAERNSLTNQQPNDLRANSTSIQLACQFLADRGLNQGSTGNVSIRSHSHGNIRGGQVDERDERTSFLISPSGIPYHRLNESMMVRVDDKGTATAQSPGLRPSTEWPFHQAIYRNRPEIGAIVHCHSPFATTLSINRVPIPACHYLVAAFGGNDIRCAPYARFGSFELSHHAVMALQGRLGCLLANHGMIAIGKTLDHALWNAEQLEVLANVYWHAHQFGEVQLLTEEEMEEARAAMAGYLQGADSLETRFVDRTDQREHRIH